MKFNHRYIVAVAGPILALSAYAQAPLSTNPAGTAPPPPVQSGRVATHSSRVRTVVYGPGGEIQAFTLHDGVSATVPADLGMRLQNTLRKGERVRVTGPESRVAGQKSLAVQTMTVEGQTFDANVSRADGGVGPAGMPPPPPPIAAGARGPADRPGCGAPPPPPPGPIAPPPPPQGGAAVAAPPPPPPASLQGRPVAPPPPSGATPPPPPAAGENAQPPSSGTIPPTPQM